MDGMVWYRYGMVWVVVLMLLKVVLREVVLDENQNKVGSSILLSLQHENNKRIITM